MNHVIRQLQGQEMLDALYSLASYSLHASPPFQDRQEWEMIVRERQGIHCHAVFEGDQAVSVVISTPMTQNMRGKLYPAAGVWGVATAPQARRKGYCRQAMASLLAEDREVGKVFTNLYPFRESFYERLGYVAYPLAKTVKFSTHNLAPLLKMDLEGEIRQEYIGVAYSTYRAYLAKMRAHQHGMAFFDYADQARASRNLFWIAEAVFDGEVEGLMLYRLLGDEPTKLVFSALRFYYQTSRARYLLLNWIARHIDQAERVELDLPYYELPETWLADLEMKIEYAPHPAMSRILDVEKTGGMLVGDGGFSARIIDPTCPWNEGVWRFETSGGMLTVSKGTTFECELTIQGLSALIYGAHASQDFPFRGWGGLNQRVQSIQQTMFTKVVPYMHEIF